MGRSNNGSRPAQDSVEAYYEDAVRRAGKKFKEFDWPSANLLFNLFYTCEVASAPLERSVGAHGLSLSAFNVLMILSRSETKGCHFHRLSELLVVSKSNVTGLVDCLEKRGLVRRAEGGPDRRRRVARITEAGEKLLEAILPEHYDTAREMLDGMSDKEKAALSELLSKVRRCVRQADQNPAGRKRGTVRSRDRREQESGRLRKAGAKAVARDPAER
jgi:MarR family 2-MHQ and catechol resistance regulon transcriptional repressor